MAMRPLGPFSLRRCCKGHRCFKPSGQSGRLERYTTVRTALAVTTCAACMLPSRLAHGQTLTTEAALTAGYSTDHVTAAPVQASALRVLKRAARHFGEGSGAGSAGDDDEP